MPFIIMIARLSFICQNLFGLIDLHNLETIVLMQVQIAAKLLQSGPDSQVMTKFLFYEIA